MNFNAPVLGPMAAVLDACAMLAYLYGEPGGDVVGNLVANPANAAHAHVVNIIEVYYNVRRTNGTAIADLVISSLRSDGVVLHDDMEETFWKSVGALKAGHAIALGDYFCLALAQRIGGEVLTSDHGEFDALVPLGLNSINFIR